MNRLWLGELPSGESTFGQNDLLPSTGRPRWMTLLTGTTFLFLPSGESTLGQNDLLPSTGRPRRMTLLTGTTFLFI